MTKAGAWLAVLGLLLCRSMSWGATCTTLWYGGTGPMSANVTAALAACNADLAGNSGVSGSCSDVGGGYVAENFHGVNPPYTQGRSCWPYGSCPAPGTLYSSGVYDYGTSATTGPAVVACTSGGCYVSFTGSAPTGRSLVGGVYHYWASGNYAYMDSGSVCTPSSGNAVPGSQASIPSNTCGGTDVATVINGQVKCVVKSTGAISSSSPADSKMTQTTASVTNSDSTVTKTTTTTYPDGSVATQTATYANSSATTPTAVSISVAGPSTSQAAGANPGASATGSSGSSGSWPSDYARAGEAAGAATTIVNALGGKLDTLDENVRKITDTGNDPSDPTVPGSSEWDSAFFSGTFDGLKAWQVPAHSSACPVGSFSFHSTTYVINSHCQLFSDNASVIAAAMAVVYTIAALFIVLGA